MVGAGCQASLPLFVLCADGTAGKKSRLPLTTGLAFDFLVTLERGTVRMNRTLTSRVAERLRRLREDFGPGAHDWNVDDDHDHLTSTRPEHVSLRTFFLGEIWWAGRYALGDRRPHPEGSSHRPALVTRRQAQPYAPVEMAPSARHAPQDIDELCFRPGDPPEGLREETWFLLPYRRPVSRDCLGGPMGTINGKEKQALAELLHLLRWPEKGGA